MRRSFKTMARAMHARSCPSLASAKTRHQIYSNSTVSSSDGRSTLFQVFDSSKANDEQASGGGFLVCPSQPRGCEARGPCEEEIRQHQLQCPYRIVRCQVCGEEVQHRKLLNHQKRARCLESSLRQEVTGALRRLYADVKSHHLKLREEAARRRVHEKTHAKIRLHQRIGYKPPVPSPWYEESVQDSRSLMESAMVSAKMSDGPSADSAEQASLKEEPVVRGRTGEVSSRSRQENSACSSRLSAGGVGICRKCHRAYRERHNHPTACAWHEGVGSDTCLCSSFCCHFLVGLCLSI